MALSVHLANYTDSWGFSRVLISLSGKLKLITVYKYYHHWLY